MPLALLMPIPATAMLLALPKAAKVIDNEVPGLTPPVTLWTIAPEPLVPDVSVPLYSMRDQIARDA